MRGTASALSLVMAGYSFIGLRILLPSVPDGMDRQG